MREQNNMSKNLSLLRTKIQLDSVDEELVIELSDRGILKIFKEGEFINIEYYFNNKRYFYSKFCTFENMEDE